MRGWSGPTDNENKADNLLLVIVTLHVTVNSWKDKSGVLKQHILEEIQKLQSFKESTKEEYKDGLLPQKDNGLEGSISIIVYCRGVRWHKEHRCIQLAWRKMLFRIWFADFRYDALYVLATRVIQNWWLKSFLWVISSHINKEWVFTEI